MLNSTRVGPKDDRLSLGIELRWRITEHGRLRIAGGAGLNSPAAERVPECDNSGKKIRTIASRGSVRGAPEHRNQKQGNDLRNDACGEILSDARLLVFWSSIHERLDGS